MKRKTCDVSVGDALRAVACEIQQNAGRGGWEMYHGRLDRTPEEVLTYFASGSDVSVLGSGTYGVVGEVHGVGWMVCKCFRSGRQVVSATDLCEEQEEEIQNIRLLRDSYARHLFVPCIGILQMRGKYPGGVPCKMILMKKHEGHTLHQTLHMPCMADEERIDFLGQVAAVLRLFKNWFRARPMLVHCDLHRGNIMLQLKDNGVHEAKFIDFGSLMDSRNTRFADEERFYYSLRYHLDANGEFSTRNEHYSVLFQIYKKMHRHMLWDLFDLHYPHDYRMIRNFNNYRTFLVWLRRD